MDFRLDPQDHLLVIGPSGSGKTTLLNILSGLLEPSDGSVCYDGADLYELRPAQRDAFRSACLGLIFQTFHLIQSFTVRQNLLLAQTLSGGAADTERIDAVLARLGLLDKASLRAGHLSVGQAQRVAVARAVVGSPLWLLCDELTSALDDRHCHEMLDLLLEEAVRCRASLIMVTHDRRVRNRFDSGHILELGVSGGVFVVGEIWLIAGVLALALLSRLIPAMFAYRTDVVKTLTRM